MHQDALVGEEVPTCFLRVFVPFSLGHSQNKRAKEALNQPLWLLSSKGIFIAGRSFSPAGLIGYLVWMSCPISPSLLVVVFLGLFVHGRGLPEREHISVSSGSQSPVKKFISDKM